jgi:hypothetical protein
MRRLDRSLRRGLALVTLAIALGSATPAWHGAFAPPAAGDESAKVMPAFAYDLPHLPGQKVTGVLVEYGPGGGSPPHHHTTAGSVVAYVLEGEIRSKVNDGPVTGTGRAKAGSNRRAPPIRSARTQVRPSRRGYSRCSLRKPARNSRRSTNSRRLRRERPPP